MLGSLLRVPVFAENDVNVGVVGEHALGAGRGVKELVGIFVGTGVGAASSRTASFLVPRGRRRKLAT